ncbi:MAG: ATP-binding protein [Pseudomonadota bacterium]
MGITFGTFGKDLSQWWVERLHLHSIKGKILVVFILTFVAVGAITALNFWNLSTLKTRMVLSEKYDDLLNNILELRRFEKNFLIYSDKNSLTESQEYLNRIDTLLIDLSSDLSRVVGAPSFQSFQNSLSSYRELVEYTSQGNTSSPDTFRSLGKSLTDSADHFRDIKRKRIHSTILRTSTIPFAVLGFLLLLMFLVYSLISRGLLKPLDVVMKTTRSVGRGDFSPIQYSGGYLEEIAGLIEAFNRMALELETNQEDLLQTRKIAAIGTFTAGIAHELNNPINNIALTAESFSEEYGDQLDDNCSEMLKDILSQAERAADIVKNLLDFSRTETTNFTHVSPNRIVSSTMKLIKNQFTIGGLQLETSVIKDLPVINGNLRNLQQVFTNLLLNAIQATPPNGKIGLHVDFAEMSGFLRFTVEDTGAGIPVEIQDKIFEPFFSTKEVGKGTGLGLAVTYSIIKRHGGRIEVSSEVGRGTRFTVLLPYVPKDFEGWSAG